MLEIDYNINRTGFKAKCSDCGKVMRQASGCNRAGLAYAEAGARDDFKRHKKRCKGINKEDDMKEQDDYIEERAAKIMPTFTFWGNGIVLITQKEWQKAEKRIRAIFRQLSKAKVRLQEKPDV